jgi:hypothetical protein
MGKKTRIMERKDSHLGWGKTQKNMVSNTKLKKKKRESEKEKE